MKKVENKDTKKSVKVKKTSIKKEKVENVGEVKQNDVFKTKTKKGLYFSYGTRVTCNSIILIALLFGFLYFLSMSFSITKKQFINYKENSDIDYKIYLKDNKFYEKNYLEKGMVYVASLIDKIHVNYRYNFLADKKSDIDIKYKVVAKLIIASQNNSNVFFTKEYELLKEVDDEIVGKNGYSIDSKDIVIDYQLYNDLANDFKSNYAVNTDSRLEVSLFVTEVSKESNLYDLSSANKVTLIIPLSQQEVNISFDNKNVNVEKQLMSNARIILKDKNDALICIGLFILLVIFTIRLIKKLSLMSNDKSKYDKYVDRLLRGYDRLIINIKSTPNFDEYNVIKVEQFEELVDARDNTNQPINYYIVTPHQKCEFFVINKNNLYLYVVKAIDFDGENINGKESSK